MKKCQKQTHGGWETFVLSGHLAHQRRPCRKEGGKSWSVVWCLVGIQEGFSTAKAVEAFECLGECNSQKSKLGLQNATRVNSGKEEKQPSPLYRPGLLMQAGLQGPVKRLLFPLRAVLKLISQPFLHDHISDFAAWLLTSFPGLRSWELGLESPVQDHSSLLVCL